MGHQHRSPRNLGMPQYEPRSQCWRLTVKKKRRKLTLFRWKKCDVWLWFPMGHQHRSPRNFGIPWYEPRSRSWRLAVKKKQPKKPTTCRFLGGKVVFDYGFPWDTNAGLLGRSSGLTSLFPPQPPTLGGSRGFLYYTVVLTRKNASTIAWVSYEFQPLMFLPKWDVSGSYLKKYVMGLSYYYVFVHSHK